MCLFPHSESKTLTAFVRNFFESSGGLLMGDWPTLWFNLKRKFDNNELFLVMMKVISSIGATIDYVFIQSVIYNPFMVDHTHSGYCVYYSIGSHPSSHYLLFPIYLHYLHACFPVFSFCLPPLPLSPLPSRRWRSVTWGGFSWRLPSSIQSSGNWRTEMLYWLMKGMN